MRRLVATAIAVCATLACTQALAGDKPVRVFVNGSFTKLNPAAIMRDGNTYISLLCAGRVLGAHISWLDSSKTAVVTAGNKRTRVHQSQGIVIDEVLYIPLRATGEAVGCTVEWDKAQRAIKIASEAAPPKCYG